MERRLSTFDVSTSSDSTPPTSSTLLSRLFRGRRGRGFQRLASSSVVDRAHGSSRVSYFFDENEPGDDDDGESALSSSSPEDDASPLSLLLFSFATPLVRLGSLKPLETSDLWPVSRRDRASRVAREFSSRLRASASTSTSGLDDADDGGTDGRRSERRHPRGSIAAAAISSHGRAFAAAGALKLLHDCVMFLPPYLLERLLKHKASASTSGRGDGDPGDSRRRALLLAVALAAAGAAEPLIINQYFHRLFRIQLRLKAQLVDALFARALRCSVSSRDRRSSGAVANLMSNDAAKIFGLPQYLHMIWSAPFQILVVMAMLVRVLGILPAAVGLAVTASLVPLSTLVGRELGRLRKETVAATDERLKMTSEVLTGVKAVKIYGWEAAYAERIESLRAEELRRARRGALVGVANTIMFTGAPILISLSSFCCYALLGGSLTADVAFPALALFQLLRFPVTMLPSQVTALIQGKVAIDRIQGFLEDEEVEGRGGAGERRPSEKTTTTRANGAAADGDGNGDATTGAARPSAPELAIEVENASFSWARLGSGGGTTPTAATASASTAPTKVTLSVRSLRIPRGSLVVVVGPVGSGKSSLLAALLGEMHTSRFAPASSPSGDGDVGGDGGAEAVVRVRGTVAYCSQEPWIQNATVRENVTFGTSSLSGSPFREQWYGSCLEACALSPDLRELPGGDAAEIGERGINLSGGQRARVALARACYSDADVYLLDDPLSAVDAHVGAALWERCIFNTGILKAKTRVLATHHARYAPLADFVVVMKGGRVEAWGPPSELAAAGVDFGGIEEPVVATDGASSTSSSLPPSPPRRQEEQELELPPGPPDPPSEAGDDGGDEGLSPSPTASLPPSTLPPWSTVAEDAAKALGTGDDGGATKKKGGEAEGDGERASLIGTATGATSSSSPSPGASLSSSRIVRAEERAVGRVSRAVYATYLSAWGSAFGVGGSGGGERGRSDGGEGGVAFGRDEGDDGAAASAASTSRLSLPLPVFILALAALERGLQVGQNLWLASWSDRTSSGDPPPASAAVAALAALGLSSLALQFARAAATVLGSLRAASALHSRMLRRVLRLPMSFFDAQPQGRLVNRFSRDVETVDSSLGDVVQSALTCAASTAFAVAVVVGVAPLSVVAVVPLTLVYWRVQSRYIATSREVKRLDSLAASPVFGAFSETLAGLPTLRAFDGAATRARAAQRRLLDGAARTYWPMVTLNRWLSVRLELLAQGVVLGAAVLVALDSSSGGSEGGPSPRSPSSSSAGLAGLALTSAISLTGLLNWMVRKATELEVNMNAVERVDEYCRETTEAPYYSSTTPSRSLASAPPSDWPTRGAVSVRDLTVRYRPGLEPALRGVTFDVEGGCKVGVAGRTGSGKSTLVLALFRVLERDSGSIRIDGVDIAGIGLFDLRSRLALVPQEPTLFSGTIAQNLDPFGKGGDDGALWEALDAAGGLGSAVRAMPGQLRARVAEGGSNLSSGQRQLLALARSLLKRPRVLVLDEATAAVDGAADAAVGRVLRSERFASTTVLTIAHRLHTIADSDRVLVLERGRVREYDEPGVLLRTESSAFRSMVLRAAESTSATRRAVASASAERDDADALARAASAADLLRRAGGGGSP